MATPLSSSPVSKTRPAPSLKKEDPPSSRIAMTRVIAASEPPANLQMYLKRPTQESNDAVNAVVRSIIEDVRDNGDAAVLRSTHEFDKAGCITAPVLHAPFLSQLMELPPDIRDAIDVGISNIARFHRAQQGSNDALQMETMPAVVCSRFSRPIARVGLYIPGGTAVLPSTAMMLGVPPWWRGVKRSCLPPRLALTAPSLRKLCISRTG
ncbi:histidinol dehydrogenase-domain-containing protein [Aspergillus lucknowensis]|uniref:Histidinol dehydrogenase-domain-containing protein n=1 Tax=Aspergillus lucknowensis TaxID=176173 RepID=A0ABR4L5F9_9EURO